MNYLKASSDITNETAITRRELVDALDRLPQYQVTTYPFDQADAIIRNILDHRNGKQTTHANEDKSAVEITMDELAAALKRQNVKASPAGWHEIAVKVMDDIKKHKDPDLDDSDIVIDADNTLWQYEARDMKNEDDHGWYVFGNGGRYPFDAPKRPIERVDVGMVKSRATF